MFIEAQHIEPGMTLRNRGRVLDVYVDSWDMYVIEIEGQRKPLLLCPQQRVVK